MTPSEFREAVREMRAAQRSYFKSRRSADLERSKTAERRVDRELAETAGEPRLFGERTDDD